MGDIEYWQHRMRLEQLKAREDPRLRGLVEHDRDPRKAEPRQPRAPEASAGFFAVLSVLTDIRDTLRATRSDGFRKAEEIARATRAEFRVLGVAADVLAQVPTAHALGRVERFTRSHTPGIARYPYPRRRRPRRYVTAWTRVPR